MQNVAVGGRPDNLNTKDEVYRKEKAIESYKDKNQWAILAEKV